MPHAGQLQALEQSYGEGPIPARMGRPSSRSFRRDLLRTGSSSLTNRKRPSHPAARSLFWR